MNMLWTQHSAASATGGKACGTWQARRVEIDSRRVQPGDLFVGIKGEVHDGHNFVQAALKQGAVAVLVSRLPEGMAQDAPHLLVRDTLKALEDLAKDARKRSRAKIVGVTGSAGKTSTKDMMKLALSAHDSTYATSGNFNNHIGMPLNLANLPESTQFAVFEMGMNHAGEISHLTRMVRPHVAIITNVEAVHMEFFDSVEGIADAKAEIFEGVEQGVAVLNVDNAQFARLKKAAEAKGLQVISVGRDASADCHLLKHDQQIAARIAGQEITYRLPALGAHMVANSLLVLGAIHALGLDVATSAEALSQFEEPDGRGRVVPVTVEGKSILLIDDSYNASPASMRAAFAKAEMVAKKEGKGRLIGVVGDMLELGPKAASMHAELAQELGAFAQVFTAGALMQRLHDVLPPEKRGEHAETAKELLPLLTKNLRSGDIVLIKGSHGSKMHEVAKALLGPAAAEGKKHAV